MPDAPTPLDLDAIEAAIAACRTYNFGMYQADRLAHEHAPALVEEVKRLRAALDDVGEALDSAQSDVMAQALTASRAVAKARENASRRKAERDEARAEVAQLREGAQVLRGWIAEHEETIVETSDALDEARQATRPAPAWDEEAVVEAVAREVYRRLHPGRILTHDSKRTPESDAREADTAYATWDAGREGWAPGRTCREVAARALAVVREHLPVKPGREGALKRAYRDRQSPIQEEDAWAFGEGVRAGIDAVLDLWPGRSEAEVKAEALNEAADWLADMDDGRDTGQHRAGRDIIARLRARADRLAAEGGAS